METPTQIKKTFKTRGGADSEFFEVYENVYDQIHHMINNGGLDISNIDELIKSAMEAVEAVSEMKDEKLSGTRKAEIVKSVITQVVSHLGEEGTMDPAMAKKIVDGINTIGPVMFKLIVMADKGQLNLGNIKQVISKVTQGCCGIV